MTAWRVVIVIIRVVISMADVISSAFRCVPSTGGGEGRGRFGHKDEPSLLTRIEVSIEDTTEIEEKATKLGMVTARILINQPDDVALTCQHVVDKIQCFIDENFGFNDVFKNAMGTLYGHADCSQKLERLKTYVMCLEQVQKKIKDIQSLLEKRNFECNNLTQICDILKPESLATFLFPLATGMGLLQVVVHDVGILNRKNKPISDELVGHLERITIKLKTAFDELADCIGKLDLKEPNFRKEDKDFWKLKY